MALKNALFSGIFNKENEFSKANVISNKKEDQRPIYQHWYCKIQISRKSCWKNNFNREKERVINSFEEVRIILKEIIWGQLERNTVFNMKSSHSYFIFIELKGNDETDSSEEEKYDSPQIQYTLNSFDKLFSHNDHFQKSLSRQLSLLKEKNVKTIIFDHATSNYSKQILLQNGISFIEVTIFKKWFVMENTWVT